MINFKTLFANPRAGLCAAFIATIYIVAPVSPAFAQVGEATTTADPGRVQQQMLDEQEIPDVMPSMEVENLLRQKIPANAESVRFTLRSVDVQGATAYSEQQLQSLYADRIGSEISLADVYTIAAQMTNKFRNTGYILTQVIVPPQTIDGGNVKLQVVEGYVDQVVVEGAGTDRENQFVREYAKNIRTGGALNVRELERYLLLINDLPGVEARSILSPSRTKGGAADLRIIVSRDPFDALLSLDNYGSRFLGPLQASAAASLNSMLGLNEKITGQVVVAPQLGNGYELAYFMGAYEQPVGDEGTMVEFLASFTDTDPGWTLREFNVSGQSQYLRLKVEHPFLRARSQNLWGRLVFDLRNQQSRNDIEIPSRRDHIRALRVGGRYEVLDTLLGVGINSVDLEISQGLGILGASNRQDPRLTRLLGDPTFTKLNADLQRLQRVTSKVNVLMNVSGQWAANPLLSSEEFGIGGLHIGRGYDPSEIVGDDGVAGKVELQWNEPTEIQHIDDYQLYSFYDAGVVWNKDATTSAGKRDSITSVGLGVRAQVFNESTDVGAAVAFPLTRDVGTEDSRRTEYYFNVSRKF
ncbi:MAG: ShlB/FhaC/HecB family hemolysin secretion/activation protein [Alphaproteobacteria bacterium]